MTKLPLDTGDAAAFAQLQAELPPRKASQEKDKDDSDSSDSESDDGSVSAQSVRFSLADVAASLMRVSRDEFVQVGLNTCMERNTQLIQCLEGEARVLLVKLLLNGNDCDRSWAARSP
eukprot:Skav214922  [mRNA]  locus=scaffold2073:191881:194633:- [translate_table: standard]